MQLYDFSKLTIADGVTLKPGMLPVVTFISEKSGANAWLPDLHASSARALAGSPRLHVVIVGGSSRAITL